MDLPVVDGASDLVSKAINFLLRKLGSVGKSQRRKPIVLEGAIASVELC